MMEGQPNSSSQVSIITRKPKRVLHFSDGIVEEYSSDEEGVHKIKPPVPLANHEMHEWLPWMGHRLYTIGSKALTVCDQVGESLATFLGIVGPKYAYEIREAQRIKEEELAEKKAWDLETAGWMETSYVGRNPDHTAKIHPPERTASPPQVQVDKEDF